MESFLGITMSTSTFIKKSIRAHSSSCGNHLKTMFVSFLQIKSYLNLNHVVHHCLIYQNCLLHCRIINKLSIHRIVMETYFSIWWQSSQYNYECLEETDTDRERTERTSKTILTPALRRDTLVHYDTFIFVFVDSMLSFL